MRKATEYVLRDRSIRTTLFRPLALLLLVLIVAMGGAIFYGGVVGHLNQNALDILDGQVKNRKNYLEADMVDKWAALDLTVSRMDAAVEALRAGGKIDLGRVDDDQNTYMPILDALSGELIAAIRSNAVTGAYVVLSSGPLDPAAPRDKKGLYLRDLDPTASASVNNADLLIKRGPVALTEKLGIATDSDWRTQFAFEELGRYQDFFAAPYQAALRQPSLSWSDLGCWSEAYTLIDDTRQSISYSVPLRLKDGTLYGVLGVDLTVDYLSEQLPARELVDGAGGSYLLAVTEDGERFRPVLANGRLYAADEEIVLTPYEDAGQAWEFGGAGGRKVACVEYLTLYDTNAPFAGSRWALIGVADRGALFRFSHSVQRMAFALSALLFVIGIAMVRLLSAAISKPITALSRELEQADRRRPIRLHRTRIQEIDRMAGEIETLSEDVFGASMKFADILRMASIRLGGFEVDEKEGRLFVTEGFFDIFHLRGLETRGMTAARFEQAMRPLGPFVVRRENSRSDRQEIEFRLPETPTESLRYIRLRCIMQDGRITGLAEDVTDATLERQKVERERDHDLLTGLLSRRAFHRRMRLLLAQDAAPAGVGALLMLDLDNLKYVNDTYGHDSGDKYICALADVLRRTAPEGHALLCRQSGDEMFAFYYGYDDAQPICGVLQTLRQALCSQTIPLPGGGAHPVSASGGVAWYPRDSADFDQLARYADFAMYETKRSSKGGVHDFDLAAYRAASRLQICRKEFGVFLAQERAVYYWQPIAAAKTGALFAYEALLRTDMDTLRAPKDILEIARNEGRLDDIERITLFCAMNSFAGHCEAGRIPPDCRAFLNSIPNQVLSYEDAIRFEGRFAAYLPRIVIEITESDRLRENVLQEKREWSRRWNAQFALDDYGSGYSSEVVLLSVAPEYVKLDMSIVRGIDADRDKQQLVRSLIAYTAERGIRVIAEGVETRGELETVVRLGADFVQGYLIGRPAETPPAVSAQAREILRRLAGGA